MIEGIAHRLRHLDSSSGALRRFGILVGLVLCLFAEIVILKMESILFAGLLAGSGALLIGFGLVWPASLKRTHWLWMGLALILGECVSRLILLIVFYLVVVPIGLVAKLFGKRFMDIHVDTGQSSYWIEKDTPESGNYDKLF